MAGFALDVLDGSATMSPICPEICVRLVFRTVTMPGFHEGRAPRNKGRRYPADPPTIEDIIAVMRAAGSGAEGIRLRALIVILWRAGLRIGEALDLAETDLDAARGAVLVRRGKGGRRREVGMDRWAWSQLEPWLVVRRQLPVGALLCVSCGATAGQPWRDVDLSAGDRQLRDHRHRIPRIGVRPAKRSQTCSRDLRLFGSVGPSGAASPPFVTTRYFGLIARRRRTSGRRAEPRWWRGAGARHTWTRPVAVVESCVRARAGIRARPLCWESARASGVRSRAAVPLSVWRAGQRR
ncbi:MAG: tyrosine-type recombinase/integrase, partial [Solirubrobacteraceae bacterium]